MNGILIQSTRHFKPRKSNNSCFSYSSNLISICFFWMIKLHQNHRYSYYAEENNVPIYNISRIYITSNYYTKTKKTDCKPTLTCNI